MTRSRYWLYGGWGLITLLVLVTIALVVGHWTSACTLPALLDDKARPTTWCLEFWINRYQTLLGALVAVGAGAAAYFGSVLQVGAAQVAIIRNDIDTIQDLIAVIDDITRDVRSKFRYEILRAKASILSIESKPDFLTDTQDTAAEIHRKSVELGRRAYAPAVSDTTFDHVREYSAEVGVMATLVQGLIHDLQYDYAKAPDYPTYKATFDKTFTQHQEEIIKFRRSVMTSGAVTRGLLHAELNTARRKRAAAAKGFVR